mgnify:CR=1 FL=1
MFAPSEILLGDDMPKRREALRDYVRRQPNRQVDVGPPAGRCSSGSTRLRLNLSSRLLARSQPSTLEESVRSLTLKIQRFLACEEGPTAVEYAVMLALIVVVCITAIQAVGQNANTTFDGASGVLEQTNADNGL